MIVFLSKFSLQCGCIHALVPCYLLLMVVSLVPVVLTSLFLSSLVKDATCNNTDLQFKYVTWQLQVSLANLTHSCIGISDEVQEEV
jgi:hypothetical protein